MKKLLLIFAVLVMTGCATKQYPLLPAVSSEEAALFTCRDVKIEMVKAESTLEEINQIGQFSGGTVTGFLGDFGIGNGLAKSKAVDKAEARLQQLKDLYQKKDCEEWEKSVAATEEVKPVL